MEFVRADIGAEPIVTEGYFDASPGRLFEAWTDPKIVMQWFGPEPNSLHSATIDLRVGGAWQFVKSRDKKASFGFEGRYLVVEPGQRLVLTWRQFTVHPSGEKECTTDSKVEVFFVANGRGTDLRVVHSEITNDEIAGAFHRGWKKGFENLSAVFSAH